MIHPRDRMAQAMAGVGPSLNPGQDPMHQSSVQMAQVTVGGPHNGDMSAVYEEPTDYSFPHSQPSPLPAPMRFNRPDQMPGIGQPTTSGFNNPAQAGDAMGQSIERWRGDFIDSARRMQRRFLYSQ